MFLAEFFGFFSLSALVMWGFLMAFLFNIFVFTLDVKRKSTLMLSSFILMLSYSATDYFFTWISYYNTTYFDWAVHDLITILCLGLSYKVIKVTTPSFLYLTLGLSINMLLALLMHVDVFINNNTKPWFFWDAYTFGVTINDFIMIVALIVDRDFLGLHKLKSKVLSLFKKPKLKYNQ
ncbi:hypothetical protein [Pseudoalteromonas sp. JB197]|uniref:hypothetical protein n=1 Tax=Pseudoalteromonas sp. JB197 TaxID=1434839 RepID=UPI00097EA8B3|nr:hypothetical protein [Pseudoalteromonas sp. JB197]PCC12179.1 hypothetical protein CIK86_02060 [Pseudoalteromonas sp. JB197]SJN24754.1 putative membrane protein; triplicated sequence [Pseudoalteromonas sp. JB197]